jgi:phosphatidylglycerol---prolipoprotein diacylglyceryl transferase
MSVTVRWIYAVVLLLAVVIAWLIVQRNQKRLPLSSAERWLIGGAAFIGSMVGAKVPFLLEQGWDGIYRGSVWFSDGKTILGGIFGGYLAVEAVKWIARIKTRTGDSFALPIAIAVAIGRVGCFLAGCCYGCETRMPWGVAFPSAQDPAGVMRHPTQLYEVTFHGIAALSLVVFAQRRWFVQHQLKLYLIAYLVYRFFSEWIRPESAILLNLTVYQIASVVLTAVLVVFWVVDDRYDSNGYVAMQAANPNH